MYWQTHVVDVATDKTGELAFGIAECSLISVQKNLEVALLDDFEAWMMVA